MRLARLHRRYYRPPNLWLDLAENADVARTYVNLTSTATGTSGTKTVVCSGDESTLLFIDGVGQLIRLNGTDVYTIASVATAVGVTTITTIEDLATNYVAVALAIERVTQMFTKPGSVNQRALPASNAARPMYATTGINGLPCTLHVGELNSSSFFSTAEFLGGSASRAGMLFTNSMLNGGFTVSSVFKPFDTDGNATNSRTIISDENRFVPTRGWQLSNNNFDVQPIVNALDTSLRAEYTPTSDAQIVFGVWNPGTPARVYRDGVLVATATGNCKNICFNSEGVKMGGTINDGGLEPFKGLIGEIKTWPIALTEPELLVETRRYAQKWGITLA